jgi:hypothetical protein
MKKILLIIFLMLIPTIALANNKLESEDIWLLELETNLEGYNNFKDFIYIGENPYSSDGVDQYDIPKPPMNFDRFYIWSDRPNLTEPYTMLWYEYRAYPNNYQEWDIKGMFYPIYCPDNVIVSINWDKEYVKEKCSYRNIYFIVEQKGLIANNNYIDMKEKDNYNFNCNAYQIYSFKIIMNDLEEKI